MAAKKAKAKKLRVTAAQVVKAFAGELAKRGFRARRAGDTWSLEHDALDGAVTVSIENLVRNAVRDQDLSFVPVFVSRLMPTPLPAWREARARVFWSLEPVDVDAGDALRADLTPRVQRLLVWVPADDSLVRWLTPADLKAWGVKRAEVEKQAAKNLDGLIATLEPEVDTIDGMKLAMIPLHPPLKASVLLAPKFKKFIAPLGWPVLAAAPCRDFVYVYPNDAMALVQGSAAVIVREFENSGYPLSTEVWRVGNKGIEALGAFGPA